MCWVTLLDTQRKCVYWISVPPLFHTPDASVLFLWPHFPGSLPLSCLCVPVSIFYPRSSLRIALSWTNVTMSESES